MDVVVMRHHTIIMNAWSVYTRVILPLVIPLELEQRLMEMVSMECTLMGESCQQIWISVVVDME